MIKENFSKLFNTEMYEQIVNELETEKKYGKRDCRDPDQMCQSETARIKFSEIKQRKPRRRDQFLRKTAGGTEKCFTEKLAFVMPEL